jgi:hypothetical protein
MHGKERWSTRQRDSDKPIKNICIFCDFATLCSQPRHTPYRTGAPWQQIAASPLFFLLCGLELKVHFHVRTNPTYSLPYRPPYCMSRTNLSNICLVRRAARRVQKQNALYQYSAVHSCHAIGGAHQQTSERVAPPVSVEEKGKTTGDKKENCYYFCLWAFKIKINFIYVVRRAPENY